MATVLNEEDQLEFVSLFFSSFCNLNCAHCNYKFEKRTIQNELPVSVFLAALSQAKELGAKSANITGGEIFVRKDIFDLLDGAFAQGYTVNIETNATLLKEERIKKLASYGDKLRVAISLDGFSEEIHESVRGPHTFLPTMDAIKQLAKTNVRVRVNTVLQRSNKHQIRKMAEYFVEELGIGFRLLPTLLEEVTYPPKPKTSCDCDDLEINYNDVFEFMNDFMFDFMRKHEKEDVSVSLNMALVPIDIENYELCSWGVGGIGISYDGQISLCHKRSPEPMFNFGNIQTDKLADIWKRNEAFQKFKHFDVTKLTGVCSKCLAKTVCRGGCRIHAWASYRNVYAPDPQCQRAYERGQFPQYAISD